MRMIIGELGGVEGKEEVEKDLLTEPNFLHLFVI